MRLVIRFGDEKRYSDREFTRSSSRRGSTTKQGATRMPSKRFSENATPPTMLRQQSAISAAEPSTVP
jgi:hypothetical protein